MTTGITYATIRGFRPLLLDLHLPAGDGPFPLVVWIHGGGFRFGDRRFLPETVPPGSVFSALTTAGIAVATIDYRLSGEALFPAQLDDVQAAITFLRENSAGWRLDPDRVGVWGESAGGTLAALAALAPDSTLTAAALWYPITDFLADDFRDTEREDSPEAALIGGLPSRLPDAARAASPLHQVRPGAPAFLITHGTEDKMVPATQSADLHDRLLAVGADSAYVRVEGADHIFIGHPDPVGLIDRTVTFFAEQFASAD